MTLNFKTFAVVTLSAFVVSACGLFSREEKIPEYYEVEESEPLTIPENLDRPSSNQALVIDHQPIPLPSEPTNPVPPRVVVNQTRGDDGTIMRWASEGVYILIDESPEVVKDRLGGVIEESGMQLLGKDNNGDFRFVFDDRRPEIERSFWDRMSFWNNSIPDYSGSYLTLSQRDGSGTRIYLKYADGGEVPIEAAEYVLAILKDNLG